MTSAPELVEVRRGPAGAIAFLRAYLEAPNDADLEVRLGKTKAGESLVCCAIGSFKVALNSYEMGALKRTAESALEQFGLIPETEGLPNLILCLGHAIKALDDRIGKTAT